MNILLTNDDGYSAKGIQSLKNALKREGHNVYISAPAGPSSCSSQALTVNNPIRVEKIEDNDDSILVVNGFPADCIFPALLDYYKDIHFDLVVSGINNGANLGYDVNYSGTIGAAREALAYGIPTLAVSYFTHNPDADFTPACNWTVKIIDRLYKDMRNDVLYNLNVPYLPDDEIRGFYVCPMSQFKYFKKIEKINDPYGRDYFFILGDYKWELVEGLDAKRLVDEDCVTLTPISLDYTDYKEIQRLNNVLRGIK